jgi:hypothetical protein
MLYPMLYTAKCYWPGATESDLREAFLSADVVDDQPAHAQFCGALYLPGDELVLCLFDGPSAGAVRQAAERALLPCERIMASVWMAPTHEGEA